MFSEEPAGDPVRRGGADLPPGRQSERRAFALRFRSSSFGPFSDGVYRDARSRREAMTGSRTASSRGDGAYLLGDQLRDASARR